MTEQVLIALDQGTTSSRAVVFSLKGQMIASRSLAFAQLYPQPGWVEHRPSDLLSSTVKVLQAVVREAGIRPEQIAAIGITNQRETTLLWDRATGREVYNAIVWQCRRTAGQIEGIKARGLGPMIRQKTGLVPDAYFSASKLQWLLKQAGIREQAQVGRLCFGTVDSFLAWHLVEGHPHITDATNAGRTMLFNIHTQDWDDELLELFDIPRAVLPRVADTAQVIGRLNPDILGHPVPVAALAGDQHAALFGQGCIRPGSVKNTYGTGCFMLTNTGEEAVVNHQGLLTTMAWRLSGKPAYALEGSVFVAGAAIQWLRDELGILDDAAHSETLASQVPDTGGVTFVPAFTGLGAPHWNMYARGAIFGMTRGTGRSHLARAALEAIAFQSDDLLTLMAESMTSPIKALYVDGGASANSLLMQMQADISGIPVNRPREKETTALGAALLAGLAVGVYKSPGEAVACRQTEAVYEPVWDEQTRQERRQNWARAVEAALYEAELRGRE